MNIENLIARLPLFYLNRSLNWNFTNVPRIHRSTREALKYFASYDRRLTVTYKVGETRARIVTAGRHGTGLRASPMKDDTLSGYSGQKSDSQDIISLY